MGWRDRDYGTEAYAERQTGSWQSRRPRGATLALMILHGAAFVLVLMISAGEDRQVVQLLVLAGPASHPLGILLHPLATQSLLSIVFVVLALWSLAGRIEARVGGRRLVALYVTGNLAAGGVYFGIVRLQPALGGAPLDYPVGALAALCMTAWHHLRHEPVQVFGRVTTVAKVYAICGAIVAGLVVLSARQGALPWLAAAAAGCGVALLLERWRRLAVPGRRRGVRRVRPSIPRPAARPPPADGKDIDEILAKISRAGLDSLTKAEREQLEAARRAKLRERD